MKTVTERYATSLGSSNLLDDQTHHTTDILAAVSLSSALGSLLFRVKYGRDKLSLTPMLEAWRQIVTKKARKRGWEPLSEEVADISLWHWIEDECRSCGGHGRKMVIGHDDAGRQVLSDEPCPACAGTKKRKINYDKEIQQYVVDCVQALESMANEAGRRANWKLGD